MSSGFVLLLLVGAALVGVDVWDKRRRRARAADFVEVAGLAVHRHEVYRLDRRVRPDGRRDVVVYVNQGRAWFALSGADQEKFLAWWSPPTAG